MLVAVSLVDYSQGHLELEVIIIPVFQLWKLRLKEVKDLAKSQTAKRYWSWG